MRRLLGLAVASCLMAAPAAYADEVKAISGEELARLVTEAGYRAELARDSEGDPMVASSAAGVEYHILMYGCDEDDRCSSIQFRAGFDLDDGIELSKMNDWNRETRFSDAWIDDERDPWIELDLDLEGGISRGQIREHIELWDTLLGQFQGHIGF